MRSRQPLFPKLVYGGWGAAYPGWGHQGLSTGWGRHQQPTCSAPPAFQRAWGAGRGRLLGTEGARTPHPVWESPHSLVLHLRPRLPVSGYPVSVCVHPSGVCALRSLAASVGPSPVSQALGFSLLSPPLLGLVCVLPSPRFLCLPLSPSLCVSLRLSLLSQRACVCLCLFVASPPRVCVPSLPCPFPALSLSPISVSRHLASASLFPLPLPIAGSRLTLLLHTFVSAPGTGRPGGRSALWSRLLHPTR